MSKRLCFVFAYCDLCINQILLVRGLFSLVTAEYNILNIYLSLMIKELPNLGDNLVVNEMSKAKQIK